MYEKYKNHHICYSRPEHQKLIKARPQFVE